jgi:aspartate/methionine/tyrosine aminotransferase
MAALDVGRSYCAPFVAELARVRRLVRERLATLSDIVEVPEPLGAFYFLLRVRTALDPFTLVERLVREHHVAAIPGTAFGLDGVCSLRISYGALAPDTVAEGIDRLVAGVRRITQAAD